MQLSWAKLYEAVYYHHQFADESTSVSVFFQVKPLTPLAASFSEGILTSVVVVE